MKKFTAYPRTYIKASIDSAKFRELCKNADNLKVMREDMPNYLKNVPIGTTIRLRGTDEYPNSWKTYTWDASFEKTADNTWFWKPGDSGWSNAEYTSEQLAQKAYWAFCGADSITIV